MIQNSVARLIRRRYQQVVLSLLITVFVAPAQALDLALVLEDGNLIKGNLTLIPLNPETHEPYDSILLGDTYPNPMGISAGRNKAGTHYYLTYTPRKPKYGNREVVVLDAKNGKETARFPLGERVFSTASPRQARLRYQASFLVASPDGKRLVSAARRSRREWVIQGFELPSHRSLGTLELPKGVARVRFIDDDVLAVTTDYITKGKAALYIIDARTMTLIEKHELDRRTMLNPVAAPDGDTFQLILRETVGIDRDPKTRKLIEGDRVYLYRFDKASGAQVGGRRFIGIDPTPVFRYASNEYGWFTTRRSVKEQGLTLWRTKDGQIEEVIKTDVHATPKLTLVREDLDTALILGDRLAMVFSLSTGELIHEPPLGFKPHKGFFSKDGKRVFLREASGSEIAYVDIATGQTEDARTGRTEVKIGNAVLYAGAAYLALAYPVGLFPLWPGSGDIGMTLDHAEETLYVVNTSTRDVTLFEADGLERIDIIPVSGAYGVFRGQKKDRMLVLGTSELSVIDATSHEVLLEIDEGKLLGVNPATGSLFQRSDEGISIYDTESGEVRTTIELESRPLHVFSSELITVH